MAFDANDLSPHEHFVMERTRLGEVADFTPMTGPGGTKPAVRAGFLRKLLLALDPSWTLRSPGVRLRAARIEGTLDLTDCSGAGGAGLPALALIECEIAEPIDVSHARLSRLSLRGSRLTRLIGVEAQIDGELDLCDVAPLGAPGHETLTVDLRGARIDGDLAASGAKLARATDRSEHALAMENVSVEGSLLFDAGFEAFGCVWIVGARVRGNLECAKGKFLNRTADAKGAALVAENADISGDVFLRDGFVAEGKVWFEGARIGRDVHLEGGVFRNEGGDALGLGDADIGGGVTCHADGGGCKISGKVTLEGASIARNLDLRGAEISHRIGRDTYGCAVAAANVRVGGAALFQGANIKGELLLAGASIEGYLAFGGGRYINGGQWAIRAPNARVGGNVTFKLPQDGFAPHGQKTVVEGGVKLDRARIEGALSWSALELRGPGPDGAKGALFSFADAVITGAVQARAMTTQQDALIDASGASAAALDDDMKTGWGVDGARLDLDGFAYLRIDSANERWSQRLHWLSRTPRFSAQPFAHAANVYARAGRRDDARRLLLAQHDRRTLAAPSGPFTWLLSSLFGLVAGYGLAPIRVVRALALFLALGVAGVLTMNAQGALVTPRGAQCNGAVDPALYALDVALPVIDLGQESRCGPGRTTRAELPAGVAVSETSDWRLFEGAALWRWAHALYAILGAILTAMAVITFSGVLKPKDQ